MTRDRYFERKARAWLDLMPDEVPDRVIADVLAAVERTPQVGRRVYGGQLRSDSMTRYILIAATALLAAALLGGAVLVAGGGVREQPQTLEADPPPTHDPAPSAAATPQADPPPTHDPAPSAAATPQAEVNGAPTRLRGVWVADVPAIAELGSSAGPVSFTIDDAGLRLTTDPVGTAGTFESTIDLRFYNRWTLILEHDAGGCAAGARGLYQGIEGDGAASYQFDVISEACPARAALLERTWTRPTQ